MNPATPIVLKSHKHQVLEAIAKAGLSPNDFVWTDSPSKNRDGEISSTLRHCSEPYFFAIDRYKWNSNWQAEYCPASDKWTHSEDGSWDSVLTCCKTWAGYVNRENVAAEYLDVATSSPKLLQVSKPEEENSPFTEGEKDRLADQLDLIEEKLLDFRKDSDDFRAEVRAGLDILRDELKRGGRTAFRYLVFSTLLAIGLAFLNKDETKQVLDFATQQIDGAAQLLTRSVSE